jgi:hypothetical protein
VFEVNKHETDVVKQAQVADALHWVSLMNRLDDPVVARLVCERLHADRDLLKANPGIYMRAQETIERHVRRVARVRASIDAVHTAIEKGALMVAATNRVCTWVIHGCYRGYAKLRVGLEQGVLRAAKCQLAGGAAHPLVQRVLIRRRPTRQGADLTLRRAR